LYKGTQYNDTEHKDVSGDHHYDTKDYGSIMTLNIMTLSIMTLSIMKHSMAINNATLSTATFIILQTRSSE